MKRKGFTLIELLAVIVILAIIALIAVPTVMNIINNAQKSAFKDSAYGIIKSAEMYYTNKMMDPDGMTEDKEFTFPDAEGLELKGSRPTSGTMVITKEGKIGLAIHNGRYCVKKGYDDEDVTTSETTNASDCKIPSSSKTLSEIAVASQELEVESVNSSATSGTCNRETVFAIKVNDNQIYKFYVVNDDGSKVDLLLDRNLGENVAWISDDDYTLANTDGTVCSSTACVDEGPITLAKALEERTRDWTNIGEFQSITEENDSYEPISEINNNKLRARLLTQTEKSLLTESVFIANLNHVDLKGYWLSTAGGSTAMLGYFDGNPSFSTNVNTSDEYGVRPVITVYK